MNARAGRWDVLAIALAATVALQLPAFAADAPVDSMPVPRVRNISYYYDAIEQSVFRPATRALDPSLLVRKISHNHREAENVDERDQVRLPSSWWQPRVGFHPVTPAEMLEGAGPGTGPAAGKWTVVRAKTEGVSKGFQIKDAEGARFAIKLDPPAFPELTTSADVVVSKLYWAAGYNVPDNTIAFIRREDLVIQPNSTYEVAGRKFPISEKFVDDLFVGVPKDNDGRYRVVASRFLKGTPLGEWRYDGRRKDDPEDMIPHELRREIRGLYAINAWTNHTDCSARNTLDMYVVDGGRGFVRHHLIDFSGCLGSASIAPQSPSGGQEHLLDYGASARNFVTLGLVPAKWERAVDPAITSVGFIDSKTFDPESWRPFLPNPAFDERTHRDIRWGARIVAAFSDDLIEAAVQSAHYSDPRASEYLIRILKERRDKIAKRWLTTDEVATAQRGGNASPP